MSSFLVRLSCSIELAPAQYKIRQYYDRRWHPIEETLSLSNLVAAHNSSSTPRRVNRQPRRHLMFCSSMNENDDCPCLRAPPCTGHHAANTVASCSQPWPATVASWSTALHGLLQTSRRQGGRCPAALCWWPLAVVASAAARRRTGTQAMMSAALAAADMQYDAGM
jgi:hypothetical protein